jgi:hypothetical protein
MDITRFINSRDIREHLKKIGYEFTSLEAAWLIGDCRSITLGERHEAWRELIRTMPDMKIDSRRLTREWPSLHSYLEKRMAYENRLHEAFLTKETGAVYTCSVWLKKSTSDNSCYNDYGNYLYSEFAKCQADVNETYHDDIFKSQYEKIHKIRVCKQFVDNDPRKITADFNAQWELISIWKNGNVVEDICAELDDFDGLWFSFPTPFVKGDIVMNAEPYIWQYGDGPFVLDSIPPNEEEYIASHQKDADTSDMIAVGYFQEDDGSIYDEVMHNYMNLEYYRGDMTGKRRILKALSSLMKDKIDISLYSKAYHAILMDEYAKSVAPEYFTDEGLRLAGLK